MEEYEVEAVLVIGATELSRTVTLKYYVFGATVVFDSVLMTDDEGTQADITDMITHEELAQIVTNEQLTED